MNVSENELRSRNLRMLALLAGLFLLPLAVAFWMYYASDWRPARRVNHGDLISPARPLPATHLQPALDPGAASPELFHGKWTLLYIGDGQCADDCRKALYVMRQTRLSLNTDMKRVERVFLVTSNCCAREFLVNEHPGLQVLNASEPSTEALLSVFPGEQREVSLYIVDPLGNLMMRYDVRQNPKGLLADLKKLLSLSHIG
jgi:hypothetical protein